MHGANNMAVNKEVPYALLAETRGTLSAPDCH